MKIKIDKREAREIDEIYSGDWLTAYQVSCWNDKNLNIYLFDKAGDIFSKDHYDN